jgi:hypothetical protein
MFLYYSLYAEYRYWNSHIFWFIIDRPSAPNPFFGIHAGKAVGHGTIIGTGSGSGTGISTNTGNGTTTGKSTGSGIGTSAMITQNTPAITNQIVSTTVPGPNFQRTVIFFHEYTLPGQDLFIRGGIDKRHRTGILKCNAEIYSPVFFVFFCIFFTLKGVEVDLP